MSSTNPTLNRGMKEDGSSYRVMIVDDSAFVRKQMSQILGVENFEITATAADGEEALKIYSEKRDQIDLITLDITMPKMDGITALTKLVEMDPDVNVVIVSALGKEDLVKKALLLGAKNYIVKPLNRDKVVSRIVSILQKS